LLLAAVILIIPANLYPVMTVIRFGGRPSPMALSAARTRSRLSPTDRKSVV